MAHVTLECLKRMAEQLPVEDRLALVEHLAKSLRETRVPGDASVREDKSTPKDLYGIWRDRFPPDVDVDGILHEVRHEWEKEWPEVFKP